MTQQQKNKWDVGLVFGAFLLLFAFVVTVFGKSLWSRYLLYIIIFASFHTVLFLISKTNHKIKKLFLYLPGIFLGILTTIFFSIMISNLLAISDASEPMFYEDYSSIFTIIAFILTLCSLGLSALFSKKLDGYRNAAQNRKQVDIHE